MNWFSIGIVSLLTGIMASLGLGGGMILTLYLCFFADIPQLFAQGTNLIFFLPIATLSLIIHSKNHLVEWKKVFPLIITGAFSAVIFSFWATIINKVILKKAFGGFLILMGIKEICTKVGKTKSEQPEPSRK